MMDTVRASTSATVRPCSAVVGVEGASPVEARTCARHATVYEDGRWWCRQHAPAAAARRRRQRIDAARARLEDDARKWRRSRAAKHAVRALEALVDAMEPHRHDLTSMDASAVLRAHYVEARRIVEPINNPPTGD